MLQDILEAPHTVVGVAVQYLLQVGLAGDVCMRSVVVVDFGKVPREINASAIAMRRRSR